MSPLMLDPSSFFLMMVMLLGGGVRDLASCVSVNAFWKAKNVSVTFDQMSAELAATQPADVSKLIAELEADEPRIRERATSKIAAIGPAALPALEEAVANGGPETAARAKRLIERIRIVAKSTAVRRLMAIRALGEMHDSRAIAVLQPLLESREMFEARYARAAIAKLESKDFSIPPASDADRAAEIALLPGKIDSIAQLAPLGSDSASNDLGAADEQASRIIALLDSVGNVQLDVLTWGFNPAPPGQPGNGMILMRGEFDAPAVAAALRREAQSTRKADGIDVFTLNDDDVVLLDAEHHRLISLTREAGGDLGLDAMLAALKSGKGDLPINADLLKLTKTVDTHLPFWSVARMSSGLKEVLAPFSEFDTLTMTARQSSDHDGLLTDISIAAVAENPARATAAADTIRQHLRALATSLHQQQQKTPAIKPVIVFLEGIKIRCDGTKAALDGGLRQVNAIPVLTPWLGANDENNQAPNPPPQ